MSFSKFQSVLRTLITVLTSEEQALGLQQPVGVGQRPKPMGEIPVKILSVTIFLFTHKNLSTDTILLFYSEVARCVCQLSPNYDNSVSLRLSFYLDFAN